MIQALIMIFCVFMQYANSYLGEHVQSSVWGAAVMVIAALNWWHVGKK